MPSTRATCRSLEVSSTGAISGAMDRGFGNFSTDSGAFFLQNGTVNWESLFTFGYEAIYELSLLGKELPKSRYYNMSDTKLCFVLLGLLRGPS